MAFGDRPRNRARSSTYTIGGSGYAPSLSGLVCPRSIRPPFRIIPPHPDTATTRRPAVDVFMRSAAANGSATQTCEDARMSMMRRPQELAASAPPPGVGHGHPCPCRPLLGGQLDGRARWAWCATERASRLRGLALLTYAHRRCSPCSRSLASSAPHRRRLLRRRGRRLRAVGPTPCRSNTAIRSLVTLIRRRVDMSIPTARSAMPIHHPASTILRLVTTLSTRRSPRRTAPRSALCRPQRRRSAPGRRSAAVFGSVLASQAESSASAYLPTRSAWESSAQPPEAKTSCASTAIPRAFSSRWCLARRRWSQRSCMQSASAFTPGAAQERTSHLVLVDWFGVSDRGCVVY